MANISKLRALVSGIPTTIDLTGSGQVLQASDFQLVNSGITASKPAKLDANKKITSGNIDLASEVTGTLPILNGGTGATSQVWVDLSTGQSVAGIKTFSSFPVGPSAAPTTDYQLSNKKYVDDQIDAHVVGAVIYKGAFDASAGNYDAITNPMAGWFYKVSVSGLIGAAKASLLTQGITFTAKSNGVAGNSYSVTVIDSTTGGLSYTEVAGAIIIDLGGATVSTSDVVTLMAASAYVDLAETTPGSIIVASILPLAGGLDGRQYLAGDNMYLNKDVVGHPVHADIDVIDNTEIVSSVNTKVGAVVLYTDDISEDGSPTNLWFTASRAKTAAVANSITDGVNDVAPSQNAVFDALAGKEPSITGGTTSQYWRGDKSMQTLDTAAVAEHSSYKYFTDGRAQTAAVVNSTAGSETVQAPSVSAMKSYVSSQIGTVEGTSYAKVAGETFAANSTFAVRMAVDGETAGRVYKATSDHQNAAGKYRVIGMIQTSAEVVAGGAVQVYKFIKELNLKSADAVVGASSADQGKYLWLNKDGGFSLNPATGITITENFANFIIGELVEYNATNTSEKIMVDCGPGGFTGIDIA